MRLPGYILVLALLLTACKPYRLADDDRAAIHALVEKEGQGKVYEIRREQSGQLKVWTTGTNEHGGGLYAIKKTQTGWVIVGRGVWME